jgi:Ni/Co efflux regulator RcnB
VIGRRAGVGHRTGFGWNGRRYHAGHFRYPAGFSYRRWVRGQVLPGVFLSPAYYFTNYVVLGLDPPPYGYVWVRFGPDILLVNIRTGEIVDVEYGVFY